MCGKSFGEDYLFFKKYTVKNKTKRKEGIDEACFDEEKKIWGEKCLGDFFKSKFFVLVNKCCGENISW